MPAVKDAYYDVVLDKGTLDAITSGGAVSGGDAGGKVRTEEST